RAQALPRRAHTHLNLSRPQHFWRTFAGFALFVVLGPGLTAGMLTLRVPAEVSHEILDEMREHTALLASVAEPLLRDSDRAGLDALKTHYEQKAAEGQTGNGSQTAPLYRITVIRADGTVLTDSGGNPDGLDNLVGRPEVQL